MEKTNEIKKQKRWLIILLVRLGSSIIMYLIGIYLCFKWFDWKLLIVIILLGHTFSWTYKDIIRVIKQNNLDENRGKEFNKIAAENIVTEKEKNESQN